MWWLGERNFSPDSGLAVTSFACLGAIVDHTFDINEKGAINMMNNIRALYQPIVFASTTLFHADIECPLFVYFYCHRQNLSEHIVLKNQYV